MTEFDLGKVTGDDGKGIVSIELISTSGKNKTYRITFTDESYFDYTVKDGDDAISAIVTSWEQTLSDTKVASEKLTKDTLDTKVDKVTGKGLSAEDYTTAEKTKLAGVEEEANKTIVDDELSSTSMNPLTNRRTYRWLTLKADKSSLSTVATSGSYNDLSDKPVIPSANWTTQSLGSYGTLYVNETLRLVIFYYSRSYNYTSASDTTLETGIIPNDYRPSQSTPCASTSPYVAGRVTSDNKLICLPTRTGQLATTVQAIWTY